MYISRHNVLDLTTSEEIEWTGIDRTWCIGIFIVYLLVFALMIPGFLRFKNLIACIIFGMTLSCCIPMYIVNFIMSSKYPVPENMWSQVGTFTDYKVGRGKQSAIKSTNLTFLVLGSNSGLRGSFRNAWLQRINGFLCK